MKNVISKKNIVNIYEHFGNTLRVISFDGRIRTMTYSGLNIYSALLQKLCQEKRGRSSFIVQGRDIQIVNEDDFEYVKCASENFTKKLSALYKTARSH